MVDKKTSDLTVGSPFKQIFLFSIPIFLINIFSILYGLADMVIVGKTLDVNAYSAVGSTSSITMFTISSVVSLCVGFSAITARHFGANNEEKVKRSFAASLRILALVSIVMTLLCLLLARPFLEILKTPEDMIDRAYRYLAVIFAGVSAANFSSLLTSMIRALGDSRTPLYFYIVSCITNIVLDIVFIVFFKMDTEGAALATVISQILTILLCVIYIVKKQPLLRIKKEHFKKEKDMDGNLIHLGVPMALSNMIMSVGVIMIQYAMNNLGTLFVSAQVTASRIELFVIQPIKSFSAALTVFVSQNYGAGKYSRVIKGSYATHIMGFAWCTFASVLLIFLGKPILLLLNDELSREILDYSYRYIVITTVLHYIVSPLIVAKDTLQPLGRTFWSVVSGFTEIVGRAGVAFAVVFLINPAALGFSSLVPVISEDLGFTVMCFATPCAWLFGLLTVIFDYFITVKKFRNMPDKNTVAA